MIFAKGRLWPSSRQDEILSGLEAYINRVRATKTLPRETVIRALSALGDRISRGEFDGRIASLAAALRTANERLARETGGGFLARLRRFFRP